MIYYIDVVKDANGIFRINKIINQETGEFVSLIDFLTQDGIVFVNNLDIAFMELIKQLLKMKYRNVFNAEKKNSFHLFIVAENVCKLELCMIAVKFLR